MLAYEINGIVADVNTMQTKQKKLTVGVSNDRLGRSISIMDDDTGIMYQIPFEPIAPALKKKSFYF